MSPWWSDGDVPGADLDGVPRPPLSVRFLSVAAAGPRTSMRSTASMRSYATRQAAGNVLQWYRERLGESGWRPADGSGGAADSSRDSSSAGETLAFARDGASLYVHADESDGETSVDLITMEASAVHGPLAP
jgi:hypothetical protein